MASLTWMKMSLDYSSADGDCIRHKCHSEYLPLAKSEQDGLICPLGWTFGPYSELCLMSHSWLCPDVFFPSLIPRTKSCLNELYFKHLFFLSFISFSLSIFPPHY